jgi:hypothetical protein
MDKSYLVNTGSASRLFQTTTTIEKKTTSLNRLPLLKIIITQCIPTPKSHKKNTIIQSTSKGQLISSFSIGHMTEYEIPAIMQSNKKINQAM